MHIQSPTPNWDHALAFLPDGALVKVFHGSQAKEAKQKWAAAGRDPARLVTCLRQYEAWQPLSPEVEPWAYWAARFERMIDGPYVTQYAPFVDLVEGFNEFTNDQEAHDPALLVPALASMTAMAHIWNDRYRGKVITTPDGHTGLVSANTRIVIGNVPVGNDVPREFMELAIETDNVCGYHGYQNVDQGKFPNEPIVGLNPGSWQYHAGRCFFNEQAYGLRPLWVITECSLYGAGGVGWRHAGCIGGDTVRLSAVMVDYWLHVLETSAFAQRRILGWTGAWFTTGGGEEWKDYELESGQLVQLAQDAAHLTQPPQEDPMDPIIIAQIKQHTQAINDILDGVKPLYRAEVLYNLTLRDGMGAALTDPLLAPQGFVPKGAIVDVWEEFDISAALPNRARVSRASNRPNVVRSTTLSGPALRRL